MTPPKKTPKQMAEEHWDWLESILELQHRNYMVLLRKVAMDEFVHGFKHGRKK